MLSVRSKVGAITTKGSKVGIVYSTGEAEAVTKYL